MTITDHHFTPQRGSNMCVCGEPSSEHEEHPAVVSFHMDTSAGGIPITLCACGLLIYQPMARIHIEGCATYLRTLRDGKLQ